MKVLVTGKNGQIARCLADCADDYPALLIVFAARSGTDITLDLEDEASVRLAVQTVQPDIIINAAAYTQVDKAEDEPEIAMQVNGIAPGILGEEAKKCGAVVIQISTDNVFDGTLNRPYRPTDKPNPIGSYGASKLKGEQALCAVTDEFIIVRVTWVYSSYGDNFYTKMMALAADRNQISVVDDQIGNPTPANDIAVQLLRICEKLRDGDRSLLGSIQHFAGPDEMTRFEFARKIFANNKVDCVLRPISTAEMATKANRPANSRLLKTIK